MLHTSGIYVFESKNYSGWIFGNEADKQWTQSFRSGHKERFYNPCMQNISHVWHLEEFLRSVPLKAFHSVIVFSERCELRKIMLTSDRHIVVKRNRLRNTIAPMLSQALLTTEEIDAFHKKLYPQTQLSEEQKQAHIQRVTAMQQKNNPHR